MPGTPEDPFDEAPRPNAERFRKMRAVLTIPATLLISNGVLGLLLTIYSIIQLHTLPEDISQYIVQVEQAPNIQPNDKEKQIDFCAKLKEMAEERTAFLLNYTINLVASALVIFAGIQMLRLSGPGIPIAGSVVSMVPCLVWGCCFFLGLPAGIWALVVLSRDDVRAVMYQKANYQYTDDLEPRG